MQRLLAALLFFALVPCAPAATFCVTTASEFQAALGAAANNGEDDAIRVEVGTYLPPTPAGFSFASAEAHNVSIAGGYITFLNTPCGLYFNSPAATVIDGNDSGRLLNAGLLAGAGNVSVSRLTFMHGVNATNDAPFNIGSGGYAGNITLDRVVVADNHSAVPALFAASAGKIVVTNSVFTGNTIATEYNDQTVIVFESYNANNLADGVVYTGNTAAGNRTDVPGGSAEVSLYVTNGPLIVENSVFWDNTAVDLVIEADGSAAASLSYSDIGVLHTFGTVMTTSVVQLDPLFVGNGNYRLRGDSPLRDISDNNAIGGIGSYDATGQTRLVFSQVDLGAYELQDLIFRNGFD